MSVAMSAEVKVKMGGFQWLEGLVEACFLHRVVILCMRSNKLLMRTGQCFLLNGFIFLGSIFVLNLVVIPALWWILPDQCSQFVSHKLCDLGGTLKFYSFIRLALIQLFYVLWFYPLYMFSIVLSTIWYNDIAKYGYAAMGRSKFTVEKGPSQNNSPTVQNAHHVIGPSGLGGVMIGIGQQVYSILLLSVFFLRSMQQDSYHTYGSCSTFYSFLGCMHITASSTNGISMKWLLTEGWTTLNLTGHFLLVLFVLTAIGSESEQEISFEKHKWRVAGVERLPIFYVADKV